MRKLIHTVAHYVRFYHNITKNPRRYGPLMINETQAATTRVLKLIQGLEFVTDITAITNQHTKYKGRLRALNLGALPFRGWDKPSSRRRENRTCKSHTRRPTSGHTTSKTSLHQACYTALSRPAEAQATLNAIKQKYWPIEGIQAVKGVIRRCTTCFRANPRLHTYPMGSLPSKRVTFERPFLAIGIYYCGPVLRL